MLYARARDSALDTRRSSQVSECGSLFYDRELDTRAVSWSSRTSLVDQGRVPEGQWLVRRLEAGFNFEVPPERVCPSEIQFCQTAVWRETALLACDMPARVDNSRLLQWDLT